MANVLIQSLANCMKFVKLTPAQVPQYVGKFIDEWLFRETIRTYEQPKCFINKWLNDDPVRLQFISNYGPLHLVLYTKDGYEVDSVPFETRQQDFYRPTYYIRQIDRDLATYEPGYYYFQIESASDAGNPWVSEPFEIVEDAPNTIFIEFYDDDLYEGIYFNSPFRPGMRFPGIMQFEEPASKNTLYEDQNMNQSQTRSAVNYRIWRLIVGDAHGVPPYFIDKINSQIGAKHVKYDGVFFVKLNADGKWEKNTIDLYPMAGYNILMREKYNRRELTYENDVQITGTVVATAVVDSKGFGMNQGGNYTEILDTN